MKRPLVAFLSDVRIVLRECHRTVVRGSVSPVNGDGVAWTLLSHLAFINTGRRLCQQSWG